MTDYFDPDGDAADEAANQDDWQIKGDEHATRMLAALGHRQAEIDRLEGLARIQWEKADRWLAEVSNGLRAQVEVITTALESYHRAVIERKPKALTIKFPTGTLSSRKTDVKIAYEDEAAFIEWAKENAPHLLRVIPEETHPDKVVAKRLLAVTEDGKVVAKDTGDVVPGVTGEPAGRSFSVKPSEPAEQEEQHQHDRQDHEQVSGSESHPPDDTDEGTNP